MKIKVTKCIGTIYWFDIPEELRVYYPQERNVLGFKKEKEPDERATCDKLESVLREKGGITQNQYLLPSLKYLQLGAFQIYEDVYV